MHHIFGMFRALSLPDGLDAADCLWMILCQIFLPSTACFERFRSSEPGFRRKNFSIHRVTHSLCTTWRCYSTGYPQGRSGTCCNVSEVSILGTFIPCRHSQTSYSRTIEGAPAEPAVDNLWIRNAILSDVPDMVRGNRRDPYPHTALYGPPGLHTCSGTQMEDGFVSYALGLNRGHTRFRLEPETTAGHPG